MHREEVQRGELSSKKVINYFPNFSHFRYCLGTKEKQAVI